MKVDFRGRGPAARVGYLSCFSEHVREPSPRTEMSRFECRLRDTEPRSSFARGYVLHIGEVNRLAVALVQLRQPHTHAFRTLRLLEQRVWRWSPVRVIETRKGVDRYTWPRAAHAHANLIHGDGPEPALELLLGAQLMPPRERAH